MSSQLYKGAKESSRYFALPKIEVKQAKTIIEACEIADAESIVASTTMFTARKGI